MKNRKTKNQWKRFVLLNKRYMAELKYLRKREYLHDREMMFARGRIDRLERDNNRLYDKYDRKHFYDPTVDEVKERYRPQKHNNFNGYGKIEI